MPVKAKKGSKKKCDDLFSLIIRSAGSCQRCGIPCPCSEAPQRHPRVNGCTMTTSHIIKRSPSWTRTLEQNAQCLCFKCHAFFTDNPVRFTEWLDSTIGREEFYRLERIANDGVGKKFDWDEELERLKLIFQKVEAGTWHQSVVSAGSLV